MSCFIFGCPNKCVLVHESYGFTNIDVTLLIMNEQEAGLVPNANLMMRHVDDDATAGAGGAAGAGNKK